MVSINRDNYYSYIQLWFSLIIYCSYPKENEGPNKVVPQRPHLLRGQTLRPSKASAASEGVTSTLWFWKPRSRTDGKEQEIFFV